MFYLTPDFINKRSTYKNIVSFNYLELLTIPTGNTLHCGFNCMFIDAKKFVLKGESYKNI